MDYVRVDYGTSVLITIDTQVDTLDGQPLEISGTSAALPQMAALAASYRAAELPIVHVVRIYEPDGSNVDLCRREAVENGARVLLAGSPGVELAPGLGPELRLDTELLLAGGVQDAGPNEAVIYKPRWGAFYETPLAAHLAERGVTSLVFCGCNFPNCPRTSIYEASERDFRVALVTDAISGLYERGAQELGAIGVSLVTADQVVQAVTERTRGEPRRSPADPVPQAPRG